MTAFLASPDALWLCAALSAMLSCMAYFPYIKDTLAGTTQPQRASWLIWSVLSSIAFASQLAEGAAQSLIFAGIQCSGTVVIFLLSIRRGAGDLITGRDGWVLLASAVGLGLWYITDSATYALVTTIAVSLLGGTVTISKAYRDPDSETPSCWLLGLAASVLAAMSVGGLDWVLLAYPLYLIALKGSIVAAIYFGARRDAAMAVPPLASVRAVSPASVAIPVPVSSTPQTATSPKPAAVAA